MYSIPYFSLSKISYFLSVTSQCINNIISISDIVCKTLSILFIFVTPNSLFVVAPAGYNLHANIPYFLASIISSIVVLSVK